MEILNVTNFSVHGLAAHAVEHASRLHTGVWVGLTLGTILTCWCGFVCVCGKGINLSIRPPVPAYEGLPLITIQHARRR